MPARKLTEYLDTHKVRYLTIEHSPAFTAQEVAQSAHIRGRLLAKTVIVNIDNRMSMLVLPASYRVNLDELKRSIRAFKMSLASEEEFRDLFPTCEPGALPPFGQLYGMDLYLAECMTQDSDITFCAGSHSELIQMDFGEYQKLARPVIISFGIEPIRTTPPRMRLHGGIYP